MNLNTGYGRNKKSETQDMVNNEQVIPIWGFMRREMRLEKTELLVFAVIYSFSRSCESFGGSVQFLSQWTGSSVNSVRRALDALLEKGYVTRRQREDRYNSSFEYNVNFSNLPRIDMHALAHKLADEDRARVH